MPDIFDPLEGMYEAYENDAPPKESFSTNRVQRTTADSPDRCWQTTGAGGQCCNKVVPGLKYCPMHAGNGQAHQERKASNMYKLQVYKQRVEEFSAHTKVKSLRDEISLARVMVETIWNQCTDDNSLIANSSTLRMLLQDVRALVESCQKVEERAELLLDRQAVANIADALVGLIEKHVDDAKILTLIATELPDVLGNVFNRQNTNEAPKVELPIGEQVGRALSDDGPAVPR